ncbi:hypothetical protein [Tunicatimonas pelagia]|uniref:hypothetical protein n=1 Tax=Tunicatimonas pelagia TaxID=931531 RepID=UPI002665CEB1|nr:hypothetical protein [Tunicatimonas pelagia]WKN43123.1 hypothetical protein P0M28_29210 [Tunicatimonas pelagia]
MKSRNTLLSAKALGSAFIVALLFCLVPSSYGQLGKKLKAKMEKAVQNLEEKQDAKSGFPSTDQSQSVVAASFKDGTYKYWDSNGSSVAREANDEVNLRFFKNDDGTVSHITVDDGPKYVPDEEGRASFVRYFTSSQSDWALFFTGKKIYFLKVNERERDGEREVNVSWEGVTAHSNYSEIPKIKDYITETRKHQLADIEQYEADRQAVAAAEAAERKQTYCLEGKDVASIKMINFRTLKHFGNFVGEIHFGMEATLKDGRKISTTEINTGYMSDYIITYENMPGKMSTHFAKNLDENTFRTGFIKGDKVIVKVQSKYHPNLITSQEVIPTYDYKDGKVVFDWSATKYGYRGNDLKLEIKATKHAVTGDDLYQYRVTNLTRNFIVAEGKIKQDQMMYLSSDGQPGTPHGYAGSESLRGGDAGDGGTITVFKDPNIPTLSGFLVTSHKGGRGGKGVNADYDGRPGQSGSTNIVERAISF